MSDARSEENIIMSDGANLPFSENEEMPACLLYDDEYAFDVQTSRLEDISNDQFSMVPFTAPVDSFSSSHDSVPFSPNGFLGVNFDGSPAADFFQNTLLAQDSPLSNRSYSPQRLPLARINNGFASPVPFRSSRTPPPSSLEMLQKQIKIQMTDFLASKLRGLFPSADANQLAERNAISDDEFLKSRILRIIIFGIANNFAGLADVPIEVIFQFLKEHSNIQALQHFQATYGLEYEAFAATLFRKAVKLQEADTVELLLKRGGFNPNEIVCTCKGMRRSYTPVELSSRYLDTHITKLLIYAKADVNKTVCEETSFTDGSNVQNLDICSNDSGALRCAITRPPEAFQNQPPSYLLGLVSILLGAGAKTDDETLALAIYLGNADVVECLIYHDLNTRNCLRWIEDYWLGHLITIFDDQKAFEIVQKIVVEARADKNHILVYQGLSDVLDIASGYGYFNVAQFLIQSGAILSAWTLSEAVRSKNKYLIRLILKEGGDITGPATYGYILEGKFVLTLGCTSL
ncbi:hypothetical protein BP5796_11550 [Coleophoma crateriformis]|uniref:Uncharacterized protein n=1 Tax=Coleophoma crateriformis TaxID=565419 RepID=A0A3D8QIW9_9HELO|nr:hypothetical protein BP5796_11550 [Coleophoma crateriformis]